MGMRWERWKGRRRQVGVSGQGERPKVPGEGRRRQVWYSGGKNQGPDGAKGNEDEKKKKESLLK